MAFKIKVEDRVPTYPGRVKLVKVSGTTDTYTLTRDDMPITEGTPINKVLFDHKADTLTENVIVYVSTTGSDATGLGTIDSPFATIQKAVNALPKHLGGYTAEISVGFGTYAERVIVDGFSGGKLVVGRPGDVFTINGIEIANCTLVETNIYHIERATGSSKPLFLVTGGGNVVVVSNMSLNGLDMGVTGVIVERGSHFVVGSNITLTVNNCAVTVFAQWCSFASIGQITGSGNMLGMAAAQGGIVSYKTDTTEKMWSNSADTGGLVLTAKNSTDLSDATLDL